MGDSPMQTRGKIRKHTQIGVFSKEVVIADLQSGASLKAGFHAHQK